MPVIYDTEASNLALSAEGTETEIWDLARCNALFKVKVVFNKSGNSVALAANPEIVPATN